MKVHCIRHVPDEELGFLEEIFKRKNLTVTYTCLWLNQPFPSSYDFDLLIIMGGPMGVNDDDHYPWLRNERKFIAKSIAADKKILGICLGAQLIASVMGSGILPNKHTEIGWFPVKIKKGLSTLLGTDLPSEITVFHWHADTFYLPAGCKNYASSTACTHQLFTYKKSIVGIQFHIETTSASLSSMLNHESDEIVVGKYIQTVGSIRNNGDFVPAHNLLNLIFDRFFI